MATRTRFRVGLPIVAFLLFIAVAPGAAQQAVRPDSLAPAPGAQVIPGQFIVELGPGIDADRVIADHGVTVLVRYTIIHGFAARLSDAAVQRLAADARVAAITPDLVIRAFVRPPAVEASAAPAPGCTVTGADMPVFDVEAPPGVRRIGAEGAWAAGKTGAGVKVAVIDTGIDFCHPDLADNYKGGINLLRRGKAPRDDNGHGTHLAGIIAAALNGFGVVGVAPAAWLYAVKVLDARGSGSLSTAVKGLDWAAQNGMRVANLSFGAFDSSLGSGPMCRAVTNAAAAGITVVSAAGNSAFETLYFTPANCVDGITVSAFADGDGVSGGAAGWVVEPAQGVAEADDTFAESFSNYSNYCWDLDADGLCTNADRFVVALMAPGVRVLSTLPTYTVSLNGDLGRALNYDTLTGTSMAAPHVAGAAALVIGALPGATPGQVRATLTVGGSCPGGGTGGSIVCPSPWPDDWDLAWEPLVFVGEF